MSKAKSEPMREMRIEIHRGPAPKRKVTGFTVHHHMMQKPSTKSSAFYEDTSHSVPFGIGEHEKMLDHVEEHLAGQMGGSAEEKGGKGEKDEAGE